MVTHDGNVNLSKSNAQITEQRKKDHIRICLNEDVGHTISTGFESYRFKHNALPEIDFKSINTSSSFLGKELKVPFLVSSMTGGTEQATHINILLAEAAEAKGWAMGVGSTRAAVEDESLAKSFQIRRYAPSIPIFSNLGAVQLNYGFSMTDCQKAVDLVEADGLVLHLNSMQEVFQPEGDTNFANLLKKIELLKKSLPVPLGVKEVGWGIDAEVAEQLIQCGIDFIDVAGAGGTSWSQVESYRQKNNMMQEIAASFRDWGIPTAESVQEVSSLKGEFTLIASGGMQNGVDAAKAIALGADLIGFGKRLLPAAIDSVESIVQVFEKLELELRTAMFGIGAPTVQSLNKNKRLYKIG